MHRPPEGPTPRTPLPSRGNLAACALGVAVVALLLSCAAVPPEREMLPAPLRVLTVNDDHPRMTPARFDHAAHASRAAAAGEDPCAGCHHTLRDDPGALPQACTVCHLPTYLTPEVDESKPHDHGAPPDL